jgi:transcriptional regulator with XRE-family HTH domain
MSPTTKADSEDLVEPGSENRPPEPFADRARRLADERGWSIERLIYAAWDPNARGTSPGMIRKALNGQRALTPALMAAVARALDVPPDTFIEYRLARARRLLDETAIGLGAAAENYDVLATVFADLSARDERLADRSDDLLADVLRRLREARAAAVGRADTPVGAAQPPLATPRRGDPRQARRPR